MSGMRSLGIKMPIKVPVTECCSSMIRPGLRAGLNKTYGKY